MKPPSPDRDGGSDGHDEHNAVVRRITASRQVAWWSVHEFVEPLLEQVGWAPMAGTVEWRALPDDDPRKIAALLDAAQHWILRVETCQTAECQAARDVSAAADWTAIGQRIRDHAEFYARKPWLKRAAS